MTKLPLSLSLCAAAAAALVLYACGTDNGDAVHGPQFGPPPERTDGGAADGSASGDGGGAPSDAASGPDADAGSDADGASPACAAGTVAVLAGSDAALSGAVQNKGGVWAGGAIAGGAARSAPSLVAFGTGFVGLTRGASDVLQAVGYGTSWTAATAIGSLETLGTPALTVLGTSVQAVVLSGGADPNKFFRIESSGGSWSTSPDPVAPPAGAQSFGPSVGTIAAAGSELVFAQNGSDEGLYVQKWSSATWSAAAAIVGAGTFAASAPPALVGVDGKFDVVLLYADNTANHVIGYATRDASSKAWSNGQVTQATAQTGEQLSVARISPTTLLVAYRGNDQRPYVMTGTLGAASITWSVPAPLLADSSTVDGAPAVAKGVCGDAAIAVFASGGQVKAVRQRTAGWTAPEAVTGTAGGRVSVATR